MSLQYVQRLSLQLACSAHYFSPLSNTFLDNIYSIWAFRLLIMSVTTQSQNSICSTILFGLGFLSIYNALERVNLHSDSSHHIFPIPTHCVFSQVFSLSQVDFTSQNCFCCWRMAAHRLMVASLLLCCLAEICYGKVLFSSLNRTLVVTASPKQGQVLSSGVDKISGTWSLNKTFPAGTDSSYKTIKLKLCYAPISQQERGWRKTADDLSRDKTCQHKMVAMPYNSSNKTVQKFDWLIERAVPQATYFVRAYAFDSNGVEVGYGQSTNADKSTNLFEINAISGRHATLDICSICFSAFSVLSLGAFFYIEKRKGKSQK